MFSFTGCKSSNESKKQNEDLISRGVVATVGDKEIFLSDVENSYKFHLQQFKNNNEPTDKKEEQKIKSDSLKVLILTEVIKLAAKDEGIDEDFEELKEKIISNSGIEVTEKEAKEEYEKNKSSYNMPPTVEVAISKSESESSASEFSGVTSQPLSKAQIEGIYSKELADAVFKLDKGQKTAVIKTEGGYASARVDDIKSGGQKPFEEVKQDIIDRLKTEKEEKYFDDYIEDSKKKYGVKILVKDLTKKS